MATNKRQVLSASMSLDEFDNGYWYATQLKTFATQIGVPSASKLRKDELERAIKFYLRSGKLPSSPERRLTSAEVRDTDRPLRLNRRVVGYINNAVAVRRRVRAHRARTLHQLRERLRRRTSGRTDEAGGESVG